ncbi:uncharacterized protein LOC123551744 isoform X2 [Mercenaria mercenaria]|uniref:uncharacterized protein LOC123551744 isoform X2 n=1 Tax=Mercenaria mercenaria TaxID=6596 RepID=UPI00234F5239|nr:uncharacterized protein LOC123551744 isoform X2 [Mercenaria mercenaria]
MANSLYLRLLWILVTFHKSSTAIDRGDSFDCDFDDGFCNWAQDKTDDFDWIRWSGETPTDGTGPNSDHTSGEGFYVYIETTPSYHNISKMNNYEARLISPQKDSGKYCLSFWYHMHGSHINILTVSIKEGFNTKELFWKTGKQGQKWILGQVQSEAKEHFQIVIEGKARNHKHSWFGDIAVDDIEIFPAEKCPTDCGDPTPEAGVANSIHINIGSAVEISCKSGYEIAGNSSIICLVNGSWSDSPECQPIDCSDPTPESGNVDDKNFQYGSVIEVTCIEGYKLNGNSSIICQTNSTWSIIPVCDQIECETMNITNGHFDTALGTTFGKTATQSCDTGYTFAGDETVTCLEAGWNGTIATCTIVDSEASALVVVYALVPVIVIVLTLVLLFVIWRKRHLLCAKAKDANLKPGEKPTIQYESETCKGYGLKNQDHVSESSEPIPQDEEYSFISDHNKANLIENTYYNTSDNICKAESDVENQYDHTNDTSKSFSDNLYSHISRNKPGIKDETTYDTTSCQNSGNVSLNTKALSEDDSYSHLSIKGLNKAMHQKSESAIQEEESEYANTGGNTDAANTEQNNDFHLHEVKIKLRTVEKEESSNDDDCEYSNVIKRTGIIETTGE